jgi:hypothetical protein
LYVAGGSLALLVCYLLIGPRGGETACAGGPRRVRAAAGTAQDPAF